MQKLPDACAICRYGRRAGAITFARKVKDVFRNDFNVASVSAFTSQRPLCAGV